MKNLKTYNESIDLKRKEVSDLCKKYLFLREVGDDGVSKKITTPHKINDDLSVDVYNDVYISGYDLGKLPIKFNRIDGNFNCDLSRLTTLENSPRYVKDIFSCSENRLETLIGGPEYVGDYYRFIGNYIWDTYGFPEIYSGEIGFGSNFVSEILSLCYGEVRQIKDKVERREKYDNLLSRFIHLINDYKVIRKSNVPQRVVIQDRLEEALYGIGIEKSLTLEFKHYKLI